MTGVSSPLILLRLHGVLKNLRFLASGLVPKLLSLCQYQQLSVFIRDMLSSKSLAAGQLMANNSQDGSTDNSIIIHVHKNKTQHCTKSMGVIIICCFLPVFICTLSFNCLILLLRLSSLESLPLPLSLPPDSNCCPLRFNITKELALLCLSNVCINFLIYELH